MTIFDANENVEVIASQSFRYDDYSGYQYSLERVDVQGKYGLVCVEEQADRGSHATVVLEPMYDEIMVRRISTRRANYDRYLVLADGHPIGRFTMVLNEWIPACKN